MSKKYQRKDFLKMSLMANVGLCVNPFLVNKKIADFLLRDENVIYYKNGDKEYDILRKGFNKRIERHPAIIALCKNTDGIIEVIKYAKNKDLPVAIKSGGHCMEGFSCNDGGMVINLSLLNNIEWVDDETIKVGPACTLSEIYDFTLAKNKIIPGGSCGSVGIGGLTLGGGYGLLSRKFGLTCDSLIEVTMVDGNGIIRNSKDEKDLLWACKGGNNGNFGVVSEMKFKVHQSPASMQSFRFRAFKVNTERTKSILENWFAVTKDFPDSCFSAFVLNETTVYILVTTTEKITPQVQKLFDKIAQLTDKKTNTIFHPLNEALKVFYGAQHPVKFKNACAGLYKSYDDIKNGVDKILEMVITGSNTILQINTLGGQIQNAEAETNSSFPHREYSYVSELQTYWDNEKEGKQQMLTFEIIQQMFNEIGIDAQYCNYPDINFKNYSSLYYGRNYQLLQQIKNKYDPDNLIRYEQSIKNS
ncbi:MAG TPA: FAD-binding oxidoreductase [Puia sp.]